MKTSVLSDWARTLGFCALVLILLQVLSGIALAFHYVPSSDLAYDSIRAIEQDLEGGRFLRACHYYGANFLIACALLALLRVFWSGAYKPPHGRTWLSGVILLLLVIAGGITGELLPWTEQAFFATNVRTNILGQAPVLGESLREFALGGEEIAGPTLLRFYILHVLLIPGGILLFLFAHLRRLRQHGISTRAGLRPWDLRHLLRQTLIAAIVAGALFGLAYLRQAPLGAVVEPGDAAFEATPEWHFLWLNQLLRIFPGNLAIIPTFLLPNLLLLGLLLLPILDRNPTRAAAGRKKLIAGGMILLGLIITLSVIGYLQRPVNRDPIRYPLGLSPLERQGYLMLRRYNCMQCHMYGEYGGYGDDDLDAPDLDDLTPGLTVADIAEILEDPEDVLGTEDMPAFHYVLEEDRRAIGSYLLTLQPK